MLSVHVVLEIYGLKVVISFNFALSAPYVMPRSQISRRPYDVPTSANVADVGASGPHRGTGEWNSWHRTDIVRCPDGNRTEIGRCPSRCGPKF